MKSVIIVILIAALLVVLSQYTLTPKENSLLLRYLQPFFYASLDRAADLAQGPAGAASQSSNFSDSQEQKVELRRVIDGDTIDVFINGEVERIRYVGVNAPEFGEACYQQASLANRRLVEGKVLSLERDETDRDPYGRLLRYVYADGKMVERTLVAEGFAEVVRYRSDDNYYEEFKALEEAAAEQGLACHLSGIFDDGSFVR